MEKNRFSGQNPAKGQLTESKKSTDVSTKWPRHSKRREQPNSSSKPDNNRCGGNSKAPVACKNRNQTNYNYNDKRLRQQRSEQQPSATGVLDATTFEEGYDDSGAGLGSSHTPSPPQRRPDLHSIYTPGSKKQSLNHLLNFHYAPREHDQPERFVRSGNNWTASGRKFTSYNKEQYLQANCQFVVRANEDYSALLASPDLLVDWDKIEQVHVLSSEEPQCPICLYPPVAAKMTKCGHVYCWPCILHYLALSDKVWRKCPICYEAIHLPDLRSAVSKQFHAYGKGELVVFNLMRREKSSFHVENVSEGIPLSNNKGLNESKIPRFNSMNGNSILTKLLIADTAQLLNIIAREQTELENQIVIDGIDAPENVFVQQSLELLAERRTKLLETKPIEFAKYSMSNNDRHETVDGKITSPIIFSPSDSPTEQDFVIDEDSNFCTSDIDIVPTAQCASNYFYFYQSRDGQPLYLHSINSRMLQAMYGSLDKSPGTIAGRVVHKDVCTISEELRRRLRYLQHLPLCSQFEVAELDFEPNTIEPAVMELFQDELKSRRKQRQKVHHAEKKREKKIFEFNERQLGKSMARSAKISIESTKQFPMLLSTPKSENRWPSLLPEGAEPTMAVSVPSSSTTDSAVSNAHNSWPSTSELSNDLDMSIVAELEMFGIDINSTVQGQYQNRDRQYANVAGSSVTAVEQQHTRLPDIVAVVSTGKKKKPKRTVLFTAGMN